jgi:hypothetical protein
MILNKLNKFKLSFITMKQIIYKEIIEIDGEVHTVTTCDYSESINDLNNDFILGPSNKEIIDYITDDITNSQ